MADHLSRIESGEDPSGVQNQFSDAGLFMMHVQPFEDWRIPFIEYLTHGRLLSALATPQEHDKIKQLSEPFVLNDETFKRVSITGKVQECIASDIIEEIIGEAHEHEGTHVNYTTTWQNILRTPYWWPTRNDWRKLLVEYMAHERFTMNAETQRGRRETIRESEIFTLEKGKLRKLEKNRRTKICIADYQIKH